MKVLVQNTGRTPPRPPNQWVVDAAIGILRSRLYRDAAPVERAADLRSYYEMLLLPLDRCVLHAAWLNNKFRVLKCQHMFTGCDRHITIYPRELVAEGLRAMASGVILFSRETESWSSEDVTVRNQQRHLAESLALVDIRLIDWIFVGDHGSKSLAELGRF